VFTLLGQLAESEVRTAAGRADAVVRTKDTVYVFEFKLDKRGGAKDALKQVDGKGYLIPYNAVGRRLVKAGLSLTPKGGPSGSGGFKAFEFRILRNVRSGKDRNLHYFEILAEIARVYISQDGLYGWNKPAGGRSPSPSVPASKVFRLSSSQVRIRYSRTRLPAKFFIVDKIGKNTYHFPLFYIFCYFFLTFQITCGII
jgi:hypothetical protein